MCTLIYTVDICFFLEKNRRGCPLLNKQIEIKRVTDQRTKRKRPKAKVLRKTETKEQRKRQKRLS